jgi:glucose-6-phosphate isomerase
LRRRCTRARIGPPEGGAFTKVVLCGIGGRALGPMLLADAFGGPDAPMRLCVLDNTDPEGIDRARSSALGTLQDALVVVISKSGGTPETRNGMLEVERACASSRPRVRRARGRGDHHGLALHQRAEQQGWLATFPMWDWVGGRTSITSAVGLLPGALLGMDLRAFLAGAAAMDDATRRTDVCTQPGGDAGGVLAPRGQRPGRAGDGGAAVQGPAAAAVAVPAAAGDGIARQAARPQGKVVHQGIAVYGNKGSTDQHAYVQQLRDGRHDFFAVFVRVLQDRAGGHFEVEPGVTSGDFLDGLWQGTRAALQENGRPRRPSPSTASTNVCSARWSAVRAHGCDLRRTHRRQRV